MRVKVFYLSENATNIFVSNIMGKFCNRNQSGKNCKSKKIQLDVPLTLLLNLSNKELNIYG
jgi:hypothetical protein